MPEYTQTEPFEIKGEWWRPEGADLVRELQSEPEPTSAGLDEGLALIQSDRDQLEGSDQAHACRGPLRFDPETGLHLSLLGSSEAVFPVGDSGFAIFGLTSTGMPVSLLECHTSDSTTTLMQGFSDREIFGHTLVHGAHVGALSELEVDRVELRIPGLLEFLWGPAFDDKGKGRVGLGGRHLASGQPEDHQVRLEGAELLFEVGARRSSTWHSVRLQREAIAQVRVDEPVPFDELRERWITPLTRLVGFAIRRPTMPERTTALLSEEAISESPKPGRQRAIDIVQYQRAPKWETELRSERTLVSYPSLGDSFDVFVQGWWSLHERLAGTADFLFGAISPGKTLESQLTALASVIEGYHRTIDGSLAIDPAAHEANTSKMLAVIEKDPHRKIYERRLAHGNELMQEDRLKKFLDRAGDVVPALGKKRGRLAKAVVSTRNYFAHLGEKNDSVLESIALYEANRLLALAIECNLLLALGVPAEDALKGVERAYGGQFLWRRLKERGTAWPKSPADPSS